MHEVLNMGATVKDAITDSSDAGITAERPFTKIMVMTTCASHVAIDENAGQDHFFLLADTYMVFAVTEGSTLSVIADSGDTGDAYLTPVG